MGIHTGEPLLTKTGYVGMDVHRAARIAAAGHGGQVLLSQATRDLLAGDDDVVDLGEHRLKDLTRPERIYQLGDGAFPPLRSLNRSTLPEAAHPLVGRATEQRDVADLLRRERLVTITGPGGTGKTRLALQLAAELSDEFPDGAHFISLAALTDPEAVLPATLQALGLSSPTAPSTIERCSSSTTSSTCARPRPRSPTSCAARPGRRCSSRAGSHCTSRWRPSTRSTPCRKAAAVELFLDRAQAVHANAGPSAEVEEICRRLDGLPLALELAAARLKLLDPATLLARLDSRLSLLTRGPSDMPERQQTLEATIAWSYDLLLPEAQAVFLRLSIFAGTFDVEAAEAVVEADLEELATLVDASLLKSRGDSRFLMLETIREFARARLPSADATRLPGRHAQRYLALAEAAAPHLTGHEAGTWLARLDADVGESPHRVRLARAGGAGAPAALALSLWRFWLVRGLYDEGQTAIERALHLDPAPTERAELVYQLGAIVISRGDTARASTLFQESLDRFRELGVQRGEARSLSALGHVAADAGEWSVAIDRYAAASRSSGDRRPVRARRSARRPRNRPPPLGLARAGAAARNREPRDPARGRQPRRRGAGPRDAGYAELGLGNLDRAREALTESTAVAHQLGYLHGLVFSLNGLAAVAFRSGDAERARHLFEAAQALRESIGIEHDPDDALVAGDREAAGHTANGASSDFDLERVVEVALAG